MPFFLVGQSGTVEKSSFHGDRYIGRQGISYCESHVPYLSLIHIFAKGRLGKFLKEVCLLNQEDIMDGKKTVRAVSYTHLDVYKRQVQAREIEVLGTCDNTYPLQKKGHSMEFLREIARNQGQRQSELE